MTTLTSRKDIFSPVAETPFSRSTKITEKLSSAQRISESNLDSSTKAEIRGLHDTSIVYAARVNDVQQAATVVGQAKDALSQLYDRFTAFKEVAEQVAAGMYSSPDQLDALNTEASNIASEFNRVGLTAELGGRKIFGGGYNNVSFQAGEGTAVTVDINTPGDRNGSSPLSLSFSTPSASAVTVDYVDEALSAIKEELGNVTGQEEAISSATDLLLTQRNNVDVAIARLTEPQADDLSNLLKLEINREAADALMAHSKLSPERVSILLED